jgi:hypothetical protein
MRKVLIATPSYDGKLDVWYVNSIINTVRIAQNKNIFIHPIFLSYDALIQRSRNDLVSIAINGGYDDMIFIDSDMEFDPDWVLQLLDSPEDVVGGTTRKKTDDIELYPVKTKNLEISENGFIKVESIGTGFVKLSKKAFTSLWESSEEYENEGKKCRMIFDVKIIDGQLVSEDVIMFNKLSELGFDIWLNPKMTCVHIGTKKFYGNFESFLERIKQTKDD